MKLQNIVVKCTNIYKYTFTFDLKDQLLPNMPYYTV